MGAQKEQNERVVMNHQQMIKPALIGLALMFVLGLAGLPVFDYLPLLILLACPLMMIFMMGAMNHGGEQANRHDHPPADHLLGLEHPAVAARRIARSPGPAGPTEATGRRQQAV